MSKGEHKKAHHKEKYPFGKIPVFIDDGFSLYGKFHTDSLFLPLMLRCMILDVGCWDAVE